MHHTCICQSSYIFFFYITTDIESVLLCVTYISSLKSIRNIGSSPSKTIGAEFHGSESGFTGLSTGRKPGQDFLAPFWRWTQPGWGVGVVGWVGSLGMVGRDRGREGYRTSWCKTNAGLQGLVPRPGIYPLLDTAVWPWQVAFLQISDMQSIVFPGPL